MSASLLLARAEGRVREVAVRRALGAGHGRLVRQALTESLLLSIGGAACRPGARRSSACRRSRRPRPAASRAWARPAWMAPCSCSRSSSASGRQAFFSLAPIARLVRLDPVQSLKEGGQSTPGAARQRFRQALIAGEMALAVLLLVCAGLMVRSIWAMEQVPLGFDPRGVLTVRVALPDESYSTNERIVSFYERVTAAVRELPGVTAAGAVRSLPLGPTIGDWGLDVEGFVETPGRNAKGDWQVVTPGAFEALGERVVSGRGFTAADRGDALQVALVNETMAARYLERRQPDRSPDPHGIRRHAPVDHRGRCRRGRSAQWHHHDGEGEVLHPARAVPPRDGIRAASDDAGRQDRRRSARAGEPRPARRGAAGPEPAGVRCSSDERCRCRHDGAFELHGAAAGALRGACGDARRDRHLRAAVLPRQPAHARDRHQDGHRSEPPGTSSRSCSEGGSC